MRNGRDGRFGDRTVPQIVLGRSSERAVTGGDFSRRFSGRDGAIVRSERDDDAEETKEKRGERGERCIIFRGKSRGLTRGEFSVRVRVDDVAKRARWGGERIRL